MLQLFLLHMQIVMEFSKSLYLKLKSKLKEDYHPEVVLTIKMVTVGRHLAEEMLASNLLLLLLKKELTARQAKSDVVRLSYNAVNLQNFQKLNICSGLK